MTKLPTILNPEYSGTDLRCLEDHSQIFLVSGEIEDGQGCGGTESTRFYWCGVCGEVKDDDFGDPMIHGE